MLELNMRIMTAELTHVLHWLLHCVVIYTGFTAQVQQIVSWIVKAIVQDTRHEKIGVLKRFVSYNPEYSAVKSPHDRKWQILNTAAVASCQ